MGKGRRAHHRLDEPNREPLGMPTPANEAERSVVVEEYVGKNGCKIVQIGISKRLTIGEELPANYDLGIEPICSEKDDDHLSQKQKAQKRGYLSWLFWR